MARAYVYDMVDTWNAGATTFTAIKMNVTDTASAAGSLLIDLQVGGSSKFSVSKGGGITASSGGFVVKGATGQTFTWSGGLIGFSGDAAVSQTSSADTILARDAANTLAQRNGVNAQTFRLYNTYTDASNYERGFVRYAANVLEIGHEAAGTGNGGRSVALLAGGTNYLSVGGGTGVWSINSSGHFICSTDNVRDIGASGANRPRRIFAGSDIRSPIFYIGASQTALEASSDGVLKVTDSAGTSFNRLQFGGTTNAFPALKRLGAELQCRTADDVSLANFTAQGIDASTTLRALARVHAFYATAIPAGGTTGAGLHVSSTSNFGVFFGSGAPTLSAAKGSLYLRSDGTTTNDRMYVNTDGATTWTAVTTAA